MYRLKSSWRDCGGWMRMQVFPEPCCSCCWELGKRPERHMCTSMPLRMSVDAVVLPGVTASDRVPGDGVAGDLREWRRGGRWRGGIFVLGPDADCWRGWAEAAGAKLIPIPSLDGGGRFPPEGRLRGVAELSECHVVMPEACVGRSAPEALDYFTPNGLPLLFRADATPIPVSDLAFSTEDLFGFLRENGLEPPAGYSPHLGPYGQCKSDLAEMETLYAPFLAGTAVDSRSYGFLSMVWRFAAARGVA